MKTLFYFTVFILESSFAIAQPCKVVKIGMTKSQVIKLVGKPNSINLAGMDNGADTLFLWNYGNQRVIFNQDKVETVKSDVKKENELAEKLADGKIQPEEFFDLIEKINQEGCK